MTSGPSIDPAAVNPAQPSNPANPVSADTPAGAPSAVAAAASPLAEPAASHRLLLGMLGLNVGWALLMQRFGSRSNIYTVMGPFALAVALVIAAASSHELRRWFRPTRLAVLSGLGVGAGMTLITYPIYALMRRLIPELGASVTGLYSAAHQTTLAQALPWVLAIIIAEELLWRGAFLHVLARRVSPAVAIAISIASYAAAQFGTGSWIVMLLALVCGTIWTLQRHFTRSLLAPLIAHLVWTPIVILLHPVTSM